MSDRTSERVSEDNDLVVWGVKRVVLHTRQKNTGLLTFRFLGCDRVSGSRSASLAIFCELPQGWASLWWGLDWWMWRPCGERSRQEFLPDAPVEVHALKHSWVQDPSQPSGVGRGSLTGIDDSPNLVCRL